MNISSLVHITVKPPSGKEESLYVIPPASYDVMSEEDKAHAIQCTVKEMLRRNSAWELVNLLTMCNFIVIPKINQITVEVN